MIFNQKAAIANHDNVKHHQAKISNEEHNSQVIAVEALEIDDEYTIEN